jgi:hypothetical protein
MGKKKTRSVGEIVLELEPLILELVDQDLEWGDILNIIRGYLEVHCPGAQEEYLDGSHPVFYYGPKQGRK